MSSLAHQSGMVAAAPSLLFALGETVTLTPKGGSPVAIRAVVLRDGITPRATDGGRSALYPLTVLINIADYENPILAGDLIALRKRRTDAANSTFTIREIPRQENGMWRVVVN